MVGDGGTSVVQVSKTGALIDSMSLATGSSPQGTTSALYTLTITSASGGSAGVQVAVTEVSPWSSSNSPYAGAWWELTNTDATTIDLIG